MIKIPPLLEQLDTAQPSMGSLFCIIYNGMNNGMNNGMVGSVNGRRGLVCSSEKYIQGKYIIKSNPCILPKRML